MAIAFVRGSGDANSGFATNMTLHGLGVFAIRWNDVANTNPVTSVTDANSNPWVRVGGTRTSTDNLDIWYCKDLNATGVAIGVGANFGTTPNFPYAAYAEFSGLSTSSPLDQTATGTGTGGTITSGAFTTVTDANQVLVAAAQVSAIGTTWTAGSGYTLSATHADNVIVLEYKIVAAQQSGVTAAASSTDSTSAKAIVVATFGDGAGGIGAGGSTLLLVAADMAPMANMRDMRG